MEGERNPVTARPIVQNKNLDVGTSGYAVLRGDEVPQGLATRPAPSKLGTPIRIGLNTFHVEALPSTPVYQYDVMIGSGTEKRGLIQKVFQSKAVQKLIGSGFIFDGNKLAWSTKRLDRGEQKTTVDLDGENGRQPSKSGKDNKHRFLIKQTNRVRLDVLMEYLQGRIDFNNGVLEAIVCSNSFLTLENVLTSDIRTFSTTACASTYLIPSYRLENRADFDRFPSLQYTSIKRNFFARGEQRFDLGSGIEAFKGVFSSMRIVHGGTNNSARLSINVDVANGTFWTESLLHNTAVKLSGRRDVNDLVVGLQRGGESGREGKALKKLRKLHVTAHHRRGEVDEYVVERLIYKSAKDAKFEKDGQMVSIYDYFAREFNIRLQHPDLPLVKATKGKNTLLPMEVLKIKQNQRYAYKMDERQTSNMIKFAVEPPPQRWNAIKHGLKMYVYGF
jgi:eukaryotic translation initiation factor 2C